MLPATAPTLLYALYYVIEVLRHTKDGIIMPGYDWYGFFAFGLKSAIIVLPGFVLLAYAVSYVLYRIGRIRK